MTTPTRFTWGDSVRVKEADGVLIDWRPGSAGSVCGWTERLQERFYTVEFGDGTSALVPEWALEPYA